jgi:membrane fusion protein, copper/silver efflux system
MAVLLVAVVGVAAGVAGTILALRSGNQQPGAGHEAGDVVYQCPMHPSVTSDHPADCPICGMKLVATEVAAAPLAAEDSPSGVLYQCPMHPSITSDHPSDCPICGMKLVAVKGSGGAVTGERRVSFYRSPMDPKQTSPVPRKDEMGMDYIAVHEDELAGAGAIDGLATVHIDPARQQLIGLRTAAVVQSSIGTSWLTVGHVAIDETGVRHVNVKVDGFVERIFVDFVGKSVRKGEPLFSLYSPELLSLQEEYLLAKRMSADLAPGPLAESGASLVESARMRLKLWDVPDSVVRELDRTGIPRKSIVLTSPISGVVTMKDVVEGHRLLAGAMPYEITDLAQVWVLIDIHESDLARAVVGMEAEFRPKAFPNDTMAGRVAFIDPVLDPDTRTARARLSFPNPGGRLLPGMYGDVTVRTPPHEGLVIPSDAVIDAGSRHVVFLSLGDGKFEPREVGVGAADDGRTEIVKGLAQGDEVVVRANFLVDSESRLRASLAAASGAKP